VFDAESASPENFFAARERVYTMENLEKNWIRCDTSIFLESCYKHFISLSMSLPNLYRWEMVSHRGTAIGFYRIVDLAS